MVSFTGAALPRPEDDSAVFAERARLIGLAYQLLGTMQDAEDAVQEAMRRFYGLPADQRQDIRRPGAWLMRTTGRIALDVLKSARAQRELYVGEWLPEPLPLRAERVGSSDPADVAVQAAEVSYALMVVLETLSPAERAVYVLRESFDLPFAEIADIVKRSPGACRQLGLQARRKINPGAEEDLGAAEHREVVQAFAEACDSGDVERLVRLLDPGVVLRSDGGGVVSAARRPVVTADHVMRLLVGLRRKFPEAGVELVPLQGDEAAIVLRLDGAVAGVLACRALDGVIRDVWIIRNPQKLTLWR